MRTKAPRNQTSFSSRILTIAGAASILLVLTGNGQGIATTNTTSSAFQSAQVADGIGMLASAPAFSLDTPQDPTPIVRSETINNRIATSNLSPSADGPVQPAAILPPPVAPTGLPSAGLLLDSGALDSAAPGFVASRTFPDLTVIPARVVPTPLFGPSVLVLQEPHSDAPSGYDPMKPSRGFVRDVAARFFVPVSKPAAPGRGHDLVSGESDRSWSVVAAGAAAGRCWNDPGLYQPQNYLSFNW